MAEFFYNILHLYDADEYQALSFTPNTLRIIFLFIWIGAVAAIIASYYSNNYLGRFVALIINSGATSPDSAKKLSDINCDKKIPLALSLRDGSVLRKYVLVANIDNISENMAVSDKQEKKKTKENVKELYFYIPQDKTDTAVKRFKVKGNSAGVLIISICSLTLLLLLLLIFGPWLLGFVDGAIASLGV